MSNELRILYVTPSLSPLRGGPSSMVQEMALALQTRGCTVDVATTDDDDATRRDPRGQTNAPLRIEVFRRRARFYTIAPGLGRWVRRHGHQYDLIHLFALFSYPVVPVTAAARSSGVPLVISPLGSLNEWGLVHNHPFLKRFSMALIERRALRHAQATHFNSEDEARQALQVATFPRYEVIPPPVRTLPPPSPQEMERFFRQYPALKDRRMVLFLGRFDATKGLDELIPAFAEVHKQGVDALLVLAGDGPVTATSELTRLVHLHDIESAVARVGFLQGESKRAALAAATVLVQPSHSENFGISAAEGLTAGLPVIVTSSSGVARIVRESGAGLVVAPRKQEIAEALVAVLTDEGTRKRFGSRAAKAAECFAPEFVAAKLENLYLDLIQDRTLIHPARPS